MDPYLTEELEQAAEKTILEEEQKRQRQTLVLIRVKCYINLELYPDNRMQISKLKCIEMRL